MAEKELIESNEPTILVLDFGSQYSHLITRRFRDLNFRSVLLPCTQDLSELSFRPCGIVLSGSGHSVFEDGAPHVDPSIFAMEVPILGVCYGLHELAWHEDKSNVIGSKKAEYGKATLSFSSPDGSKLQKTKLFDDFVEDTDEATVWMSHGDKLQRLPKDFVTVASSGSADFAAIAHKDKPIFGIQFHPEVEHSVQGNKILSNFALKVCNAQPSWTMGDFRIQEIERIRSLVGERGQVIGAVSGGVDSTVAALLMHQAIGSRFHAVLVDNGLLRMNEAENVKETLTKHLGINLTVADAQSLFLSRLQGVIDPEQKRKIIGKAFIDVFQSKAREIADATKGSPEAGEIEWLLQGTLYPDVIESLSASGAVSQTIKSHHNVGGLPKDMKLKLIEPLRALFKDEVRRLGTELGINDDLVWRHPFPGPGLGIRIIGEVTEEKLNILRQADKIFIDELRNHGLYREVSQAFAALLPNQFVGVVGDKRADSYAIVLRAVKTLDFMTAVAYKFEDDFWITVSSRIGNEVPQCCRVFEEKTSKPPATIEMQ